MKGGIDRGPCFYYWHLSYRRKFIRTVWFNAVGLSLLVIFQLTGLIEWELSQFRIPHADCIGWWIIEWSGAGFFFQGLYTWLRWRLEERKQAKTQRGERGKIEIAAAIIAQGEPVFSHAYDRGESGETGRDHVHQLNGWFAARTLDDGDLGPFATLEDALASADLGFVSQFTIGITTPKMSAWQAAALLHGEPSSDGRRFLLNGEEWEYRTIGGPRPVGLVEVT